MKRSAPPLVALLALLVAMSACTKKSDPPAPKVGAAATVVAPGAAKPSADRPDDAIAWRRGDVDAAFAEARAADKPVFL